MPNPSHSPQIDSTNLICRLIADADSASDTLLASRREMGSEHNERMRKLRDLKISLQASRSNRSGELFDVATLLTPELTRLLADPTHSL